MASPLFVIESAMRHFLQSWNFGMCPRLSIDTNANGSITVNSAVTYLPPTLNLNSSETNYNVQRRPSKRSGNGSRKRRQEKRSTKASQDSSAVNVKIPDEIVSLQPIAITDK